MGAATADQSDNSVERLNRFGVRLVIREQIRPVVYLILMSIVAGTWRWWNAWVCAATLQLVTIAYHLILVRVNPAVLNARGTKNEGTKKPDRCFLGLMVIFGFGILIVGALEVGKEGWTAPWWMLVTGVLLIACGMLSVTWAMAVNPHFEVTIRVQTDRKHQVCTTGPYGYVRHPGYAFGMLAIWAFPMILGSWWAMVPAAGLTIATAVRSAFEDRTLQRELLGYSEYAATTRYRMIPGLW